MFGRLEPGLRRVVEASSPAKDDSSLLADVTADVARLSWDAENRILSRVVTPVILDVAATGVGAVEAELGVNVNLDLSARPLRAIRGSVATRITAVSTTSQQRMARMIVDGIEKGLSVEQIVRGVPPGTTNIRGPIPAFPGIRGLVDSWRSTGVAPRLGPGTSPLGSRSYLIALTETGFAYNHSALASYQATGFVDVVEVFDGPDCGWSSHDDPDLAHGSKRTLAAAKAHPLAHPRCQRAFGASLDDAPSPSPFLGRSPTNVPGATPGLAPGDALPLSGRNVPRAPGAISPFRAPAARPAGPGLEAGFETAASRIRTISDHEVGIGLDTDGTVILDKLGKGRTGSLAGSVDFTEAEMIAMRGKVLIHNHPGAYQEGYEHATAFSSQDLLLARRYGIGEMRVVGKGADYFATVPDSIDPDAFRFAIEAADRSVRVELTAKVATEKAAARAAASAGGHFDVLAYGRAEQEIYKRASMEHWHRVWETIARQFPDFRYRRVLRPGVG